MAKKEISSFSLNLNRKGLPKSRDPFHNILSAKAGASGRMDSEGTHYKRHQANQKVRQEIASQTGDYSAEEKEFLLKDIVAQIEAWAGDDGLELGEYVERESLAERARMYLAALKDELTGDYYQQDDELARQQKEMIEKWISQLENLLAEG